MTVGACDPVDVGKLSGISICTLKDFSFPFSTPPFLIPENFLLTTNSLSYSLFFPSNDGVVLYITD